MALVYTNTKTPQFKQFITDLPTLFNTSGEVIYEGRNVLKRFVIDGESIIVKSYCLPSLFNRFIYRFFRKSKAQRSYEYAELLNNIGVGSPLGIGYNVQTNGLLIGNSYFACLESELKFTYRDFRKMTFDNQNDILKEIVRVTARLHENGIIHKDYSAGNILFDTVDGKIKVEIIDLNRIRFRKIGMAEGCENFDRLPGTLEMLKTLAYEYAEQRGFNPEECLRIFEKTHGSDNKYIK